jgi:hypothetical protein
MREKICVQNFQLETSKQKTTQEIYEDDINVDLEETECENVEWI